MPPHSFCSFHSCGRSLPSENRLLSKSQRDHIKACHVDYPITFVCPYTSRPITFRRKPERAMDFVCFCNATFTLASSLTRHYKSCAIAKDKLLRTNMRQSTHATAPAAATALEEGSMSGHSGLPPTPPPQEPQVQQSLTEQQQALLQSFLETTATQHRELLKSLSEQHQQFIQSMRHSTDEQNQQHQKSITEMHCQFLRSLGEQFRETAQSAERQRSVILQAASKQHVQTRKTTEDVPQFQRENTYTLESHERVLDKLAMGDRAQQRDGSMEL
ncbi:hypothetical protein EDD21DRAFT_437979 [Dissophora ornata]|nr:hypothetical protein EDD21DRAFT_437979 [Dissophora ornata]